MGAVGATAEVATEAETAAENAEVATRWVGTAISAAGVAAEAEALGGIVTPGGTSMIDQVICKASFYISFFQLVNNWQEKENHNLQIVIFY